MIPTGSFAQSQRNPCYYPSATSQSCIPVSTTNPLPTSASATITGGFTDVTTGTPIAVTTGGVIGTLPVGSVVVATNVGTTNGAYCKLGTSATTSDQYLSPNGGWFAFSVGVATQLTCITSTSTTTVNMTGGSGLPTGTGGGGGSSGGTTNITQVGGVNVPTGGGLQTGALPIDASTSSQIHADITAPTPAGANIIGKVGIDQTSDGTTNGVRETSQYPAGAIPITASATGTTAATTATLAASVSLKTYICSYSIRANATAATTVQNTITGVITATLTHQMWVAPAASGIGVDEQIFNPCVPSSAVNTAIAVVSGAPGSGGLVSSTATGYQAP